MSENQLQLRAELQNSLTQWANTMLVEYGASAAMVEDAINAVLVKIKEQILLDTLTEYAKTIANQQSQEQETPNVEGEEDGESDDQR